MIQLVLLLSIALCVGSIYCESFSSYRALGIRLLSIRGGSDTDVISIVEGKNDVSIFNSTVSSNASVTATASASATVSSTSTNIKIDLMSKLDQSTTVGDVYLLAENIPAIRRSVDKVMRIVSAKDDDALLATYTIQKLASLSVKASNQVKLDTRDRSFQQLIECVELRISKLKTIDLARYLWGLTVLGASRDDIQAVLTEYSIRLLRYSQVLGTTGSGLSTTSEDDSAITTGSCNTSVNASNSSTVDETVAKLADMIWTVGCVKDTQSSWTNETLAQHLCTTLSITASSAFTRLNTRLIVRVLWSLAIHNLSNYDLFSNGLSSVLHRPLEELSPSNSVILLWSCSQHFSYSMHSNHSDTTIEHLTLLFDRLSVFIDSNLSNIKDIVWVTDSLELLYISSFPAAVTPDGSNTIGSMFSASFSRLISSIVGTFSNLLLQSPGSANISIQSMCVVLRLATRSECDTAELWEGVLLRLSSMFPSMQQEASRIMLMNASSSKSSNSSNISGGSDSSVNRLTMNASDAIAFIDLINYKNSTIASIPAIDHHNLYRILGHLVSFAYFQPNKDDSMLTNSIKHLSDTYPLLYLPNPSGLGTISDVIIDNSTTIESIQHISTKILVNALMLIPADGNEESTSRSIINHICSNITESTIDLDEEEQLLFLLSDVCGLLHVCLTKKLIHDKVMVLVAYVVEKLLIINLKYYSCQVALQIGLFEELMHLYTTMHKDMMHSNSVAATKTESPIDKGKRFISQLLNKL